MVAGSDTDHTGVTVDKFDGSGQYLESFYLTDPDEILNVRAQEIAALSDGGFIVTWTDNRRRIIGARVDAVGEMTTFTVSDNSLSSLLKSDVTELADGALAVVWDDAEIGVRTRFFPPPNEASYLIDVLANDTDADAGDDP